MQIYVSLCNVDVASISGIMNLMITWEDTLEIVRGLRKYHPAVQLEDISLGSIYRWTVELPAFSDDHELANDAILESIYREWFEEIMIDE